MLSLPQNQSGSNLKDVECLKLDVFALVPQEIHHHLEIGFIGNIARHDVEVGTIKQDLAEQLE